MLRMFVCTYIRPCIRTYMLSQWYVNSFSLRSLIVYAHTYVRTYIRCVVFVLLMLVVEGLSLTLFGD